MINIPFNAPDANEEIEVDQIDDGSYKFILYLYNEDGKVMKLRKGSIVDLTIEDNLLEPFHYGELSFLNPHDTLERSRYKTVDGNKQFHETWRFRGDCRDFLRFEMHPVLDDTLTNPETISGPAFSLAFDFVVYDIEDIPGNDATQKQKKIYFRDIRMQRMLERDLYWNSGAAAIRQQQVTHGRPLSQLTNSERAISTGYGIKDIIQQALKDQRFFDNWDVGGNTKYYTTPAGYKAYDDMHAMLSNHVSSDETDNQPCILRFERFTHKWSLLPLTYYFSNAVTKSNKEPGKLQLETLYLPNEINGQDEPGAESKIPVEANKQVTMNMHLGQYSNIISYIYSPMSGQVNQQLLISTPIHAYNATNRQFMFFYEKQSIESMYSFFKKHITDNLLGSTTGPYTEFFINNTKKQNYNTNVIYSTSTDNITPLIESRNRVVEQALYNGPLINFAVKGSTHRRAGRFIAIERNNSYVENDFDAKLLGQYLTTRVTHKITQNGYTNNVMAVKPYYFSKIEFNNDIR